LAKLRGLFDLYGAILGPLAIHPTVRRGIVQIQVKNVLICKCSLLLGGAEPGGEKSLDEKCRD
jgi:hypothetical protein